MWIDRVLRVGNLNHERVAAPAFPAAGATLPKTMERPLDSAKRPATVQHRF